MSLRLKEIPNSNSKNGPDRPQTLLDKSCSSLGVEAPLSKSHGLKCFYIIYFPCTSVLPLCLYGCVLPVYLWGSEKASRGCCWNWTPRSPARTAHALTHWAISLASGLRNFKPKHNFFFFFQLRSSILPLLICYALSPRAAYLKG